MIKHTTADITKLAEYFTVAGDRERANAEWEKEAYIKDMRETQERLESRERDIVEYKERIVAYEYDIARLTETIAIMPAPTPVTTEQAEADLARALALPFVKSLTTEQSADGYAVIMVQTQAGVLKTTLNRKYSRAERWYTSKPYKIPLPVYNIRIGARPVNSLANNESALAISLADINDTAHFLPWINRYGQEVYPHWGARSVNSDNYLAFRGLCLGEYESEVTQAFRKSIADGLLALAIYLQSAGALHAYVHKREWWSLWLGKSEYNLAIVPSEKEVATLEAVSDATERDCGCLEDEDGSTLCDDECECDCHS